MLSLNEPKRQLMHSANNKTKLYLHLLEIADANFTLFLCWTNFNNSQKINTKSYRVSRPIEIIFLFLNSFMLFFYR